MSSAQRVLIQYDPFTEYKTVWDYGSWRAKWIGPANCQMSPGSPGATVVLAFRRQVVLSQREKVRIHVSADQRYRLFLDGRQVGQGPERGCLESWFYETYDLDLEAGAHTLVAQVWWLGKDATPPVAQITAKAAFVLAAEGRLAELFDTGTAAWEVKVLGGYGFLPKFGDTGAKLHIRGAEYSWGFQAGLGEGWSQPAVVGSAINASQPYLFSQPWMLRPATLPPMVEQTVRPFLVRHVQAIAGNGGYEKCLPVLAADHLPGEAGRWQAMLDGKDSLTIPACTGRRVIVDMQNYYCAYPQLRVSGGADASVRIAWAEALYDQATDGKAKRAITKGNRGEILGKIFDGPGDVFEPDGGEDREFQTLWWQAGRYLEIYVQAGLSPLIINELTLRQTHYPYQFDGKFICSDQALEDVIPPALRTLEMCSHETYMDCPFYEQLMYAGDTRLEVLVTYAWCHDDRLPRKAIDMIDYSRLNRGLTQSRYPSQAVQVIPPFSLYWILMVHDYLMWRNDRGFVLGHLPGVRAVLEFFRQNIGDDDVLKSPPGWNFMDWVPQWDCGVGPGGMGGQSGLLNWHLVMTLQAAVELENLSGEGLLANRNSLLAARLVAAIDRTFWDESRGMYADDPQHKCFSEHTQCFAILSGMLAPDKRQRVIAGLLTAPDLTQTTIYFRHYLFEAYQQAGRMDAMAGRMGLWLDLKKLNCVTTLEMPEPSRSDCHAWAAHPIYHYLASVLGVRPSGPMFASVRIQPQLGTLAHAAGTVVHPNGLIKVDLHSQADRLSGTVELPDGLKGELVWRGKTIQLNSPRQEIEIIAQAN
jgi:alpha-L-rhamnosidase